MPIRRLPARLLSLVLAASVLVACLSDVADEPATSSSTAVPGATTSGRLEVAPSPAPSTPTPGIIVATVTPAPSPRPLETPQGTTGLGAPGGDIEYDQACLYGDPDVQAFPSEASPATTAPPEASPATTPPSEPAELPGPYQPVPFVPDPRLQSALETALGDRAASYAFFVKDLATGRGAVHNGEGVFNAASLFKLFVMYEVFRQQSLGMIDWDQKLVVTPYYDAFALSPRVTQLCQVLTVAEAMEAMLSVSDNAAAVLLQDLVRSGNINASIEALGLKQSGLFEDGLPVTADDLALLMEAVATGNAVSPAASADMLKLLDHDVFENGLVSGVPVGTPVSRKTGNWSDATNVAGIVFAPFGPYVFVALTSNGYETDVIRALSSAAYAYFEQLSAQAGP